MYLYDSFLQFRGIAEFAELNRGKSGSLIFSDRAANYLILKYINPLFFSTLLEIIKDYCGTLNVKAIRANLFLVHELLEESLDHGIFQCLSTSDLRPLGWLNHYGELPRFQILITFYQFILDWLHNRTANQEILHHYYSMPPPSPSDPNTFRPLVHYEPVVVHNIKEEVGFSPDAIFDLGLNFLNQVNLQLLIW